MNTTESIVAELQTELARCDPARDFLRVKELRQQINAHETLARLRAEHETNPSEPLAAQIAFWARNVTRDADPPKKPPLKPKRTTLERPDEQPRDEQA